MNLENPQILFLLVPVLFIIGWIFKKDIEEFEKPCKNSQTPHKSALNIASQKGYSKYSIDKNKAKKLTIFSIRSIIIILLVIAIAQPFVLKEKISETKKPVIFLSDKSASFQLFESEETELLTEKLSQQKFKKTEFGAEKTTDLADSIQKTPKDSLLVILSDGNNNVGNLREAINNAGRNNITIIAIKPTRVKKDASVSIEGPSRTFEDVETEFKIRLSGKEKEEIKKVSLYIDGKKEDINFLKEQNKLENLKKRFSEGKHIITVEIDYEDYFIENNREVKEVTAEQKPKILLMGDKNSNWIDTEEYQIIRQGRVPLDIEEFEKPSGISQTSHKSALNIDAKEGYSKLSIKEYNAIVFNDVKEFSEAETKRIREYLLNGGGVVFIGGKNSLEYGSYEDKLVEDLLPVKVGLTNKKENEYNIIILIDISSSTGTEQEGVRKVEIEKAQAINMLDKLKPKNKIGAIVFNTQSFNIANVDLVERNKDEIIANISSLQSGGGTIISEGLNSAIEELKKTTGKKLIVLISDGKTQDYEKAKESAEEARKDGIKIFTIGTGNDDAEKLKEIAEITNGEYLLADRTKTASILYNKFSDNSDLDLTIANNEHFITKNATISGKIKGINNVIAKSSAATLVKAGENNLLVVWNFGNGRSAVIATGEEFARELFERNQEVLKRTLSWATAQTENEELAKEPAELKENELNEEFFRMIKESRGKVFSPKEFIQNELDKLKEETKKELIKEKKYYTSLFIEAAILLFCFEIMMRKFVFE